MAIIGSVCDTQTLVAISTLLSSFSTVNCKSNFIMMSLTAELMASDDLTSSRMHCVSSGDLPFDMRVVLMSS